MCVYDKEWGFVCLRVLTGGPSMPASPGRPCFPCGPCVGQKEVWTLLFRYSSATETTFPTLPLVHRTLRLLYWWPGPLFSPFISPASWRVPAKAVPCACACVCVSCVLISCQALSRLNGSQKWLDLTPPLKQPPPGVWWQGSPGHSFNSEIKWKTCCLPSLLALRWDPEDQASPGPEQSINQVKCHKIRGRQGAEV